jgi:Ribosomal protein S5, N-terminal domain
MATALAGQSQIVRVAANTSKPCQRLRAQTMAFSSAPMAMPLVQRTAEIKAQRATVCAQAYQRNDNQNEEEQYEEDDSFQERVVQVRRVTKVVKGGKQLRFRATVSFLHQFICGSMQMRQVA